MRCYNPLTGNSLDKDRVIKNIVKVNIIKEIGGMHIIWYTHIEELCF